MHSSADILSKVQDETLGDTLIAIEAEALISTLAAKKLEVDAEPLLNTLRDVKA